MAMWLRQSTASQEVQLGKFVDSTDGATAETGLTIANTDIKLWKEGATTQASKNSGGATHIANGHYYTVLDATDTDTLGKLEITIDVAGALSVRREFMVVPAMIYDSIVLGTDDLDANVTKLAGSATPVTNLNSVFNTNFSTVYDSFNNVFFVNAKYWADTLTDSGDIAIKATLAKGTDISGFNDITAMNVVDAFADDSGTAQAGAAGTITLRSGAVATNDYYNGAVVNIYGGTGVGQSRKITDYDGTTKVATVDSNWITNPDNTSTYFVIGRIT